MRKSSLFGLFAMLLVGIFLVVPRSASADVTNATQNPHFPTSCTCPQRGLLEAGIHRARCWGLRPARPRQPGRDLRHRARYARRRTRPERSSWLNPKLSVFGGSTGTSLSNWPTASRPDELGAEGRRVAELWACPCGPSALRRAAENIRVQQGLREKVDEGLRRARGLLPKIVKILQRHEVPIERPPSLWSSPRRTPQRTPKRERRASGSLSDRPERQYIPCHAPTRDHRRDPARATEAAARLLRRTIKDPGLLAAGHRRVQPRPRRRPSGEFGGGQQSHRGHHCPLRRPPLRLCLETTFTPSSWRPWTSSTPTSPVIQSTLRGKGPAAPASSAGRDLHPEAAGARACSPGASGRDRPCRARSPCRGAGAGCSA